MYIKAFICINAESCLYVKFISPVMLKNNASRAFRKVYDYLLIILLCTEKLESLIDYFMKAIPF